MEFVTKMVSEKPVVVFSWTTVKSLFHDFGVNPAAYELDEVAGGQEIEQALMRLSCKPVVPAVFIGGELVGGANEVTSLHLKRNLKPIHIELYGFKIYSYDLISTTIYYYNSPLKIIAFQLQTRVENVVNKQTKKEEKES